RQVSSVHGCSDGEKDRGVMTMRRISLTAFGVALLAISLGANAQEPAQRGNPPATAELQRLPQTPGAKGDQQRHYFFDAAGREMPYRLYVPSGYDARV